MDGTENPASEDAYDAALDRLLDGLEPAAAAGPEAVAAQERAAADVAALRSALGLIGDTLATPVDAGAAGGAAAAGAAPGPAPGAAVVELNTWRRRLNPRVVAAAASLLLVLGIGLPVALSAGSPDSDEAATAAAPAADGLDSRLYSRESEETAAGGDALNGLTVPDAAAAPNAAAAPEAAADAPAAGSAGTGPTDSAEAADPVPQTDSGAAPAVPAPASGDAATKRGKAGKNAADTFTAAVTCARAVAVAIVTGVEPVAGTSRVRLTLTVTEWISPSSGPALVSYEVGSRDAAAPGVQERLTVGSQRLFVIPARPADPVLAYRQADWSEVRERVAQVQAERAGADCP